MTSSRSLYDMILCNFSVSIFLKQRCVTILHSSVIKFLPYFPIAYVLHCLFHFYLLVVQYRSNSAVYNNDENMYCSNRWVIKTQSKFYNLKRRFIAVLGNVVVYVVSVNYLVCMVTTRTNQVGEYNIVATESLVYNNYPCLWLAYSNSCNHVNN